MIEHAGEPPAEEALSGVVERVAYHNEESGFCVLRVRVRGQPVPVTVVGSAPAVGAGERVDARGRWVIDRQHGQQFRADTLQVAPPTSALGIEAYLSSGAVRGVGPQLAGRLVRAFGVRVFEIIEREPERLLEVEGIGPVRQARLAAAWREQRAVHEIMLFLHAHGVGTSRAFRIYKAYGEEAVERVRGDPYQLARDIRGIGFTTADTIAQRVGIDRHSDLRARAGVEYVLLQLTEQGHCAFPRRELVQRATEVLAIPAEIVERAVDHARNEGRLAQHSDGAGRDLVYLAWLDQAELVVARALATLAAGPHPCPVIDVPRAEAWVERHTGLSLAAAQRDALRQALTSKVLVITGGPGVGKTTLVNAIVAVLAAKELTVVLAAPTGRAAKRLGEATGRDSRTIHRLLEFDPATGGFKRGAAHPLKGDVFVIDESSMIDLPLAADLLSAVPRHAAVLLVGDVDQLPSVGPGSVLRDVIDSGTVAVCRLSQVFRQAAESLIVTNAHRVNRGELPVLPRRREKARPGDFFVVRAEEPARGVELIVRMATEAIPRRFGLDPRRDVQVLTPMQRGELGARNLNQVLQEALNPAGDEVQRFGWTFRVGDRVMQTVNDYEKDVFNGDVGHITAVDEAEQRVEVAFDERTVPYRYGELDDLQPAYAVTVHKAQGSEYPAVIVPVHTQHYPLLQRNLLYTAMTRGRRLVVLVGTLKALALAVNRAEAHRRVTTLRERLVREAAGPGLDALPLVAERHDDDGGGGTRSGPR
jgi:exodeoxyribonuclease V alpha subunit